MKKACTWCGKKIRRGQKHVFEDGGYIHSKMLGCKDYRDATNAATARMEYIDKMRVGLGLPPLFTEELEKRCPPSNSR